MPNPTAPRSTADLDVEAIQARCDAATAGPWFVEESDDTWQLFAEQVIPRVDPPFNVGHPWQIAKCPKRKTQFAEYWPGEADSAFIVAARTDIPALLAEVRRLREELAGARDSLQRAFPNGVERSVVERERLIEALKSVISEAEFVLRGGDNPPERCGECGLAGVGMLRDATQRARAVLDEIDGASPLAKGAG